MKFSEYENRMETHPERTIGRVVLLAVLGLLALGALVSCLNFATNPARQAGRVVSKTIDADNVIYNYEWFHRQYGDLQAMTPKLENAQGALNDFEQSAGPRKGWQFDDRQEHSRLSSIVLGLKNQRAEIVQTYNARAEMSNRNLFIGKSLPDHVE